MKKLAVFAVATLLAATACTKKREERFAQGQGKDLDAISDFNGKTFDLKTGAAIAPTSSSRASNVKISDDFEKMNNMDLVSFKTDAKLLKDIPFRGRPNFTYQIRYELTEKFLKIVKVADEKDIPFQEKAYAEKEKDGKVKIPLMGYPVIGLFRIEKQKNSNNEDTNTMIEVAESDISKATHFKIDTNASLAFAAIEKIDVYPATLFDGDWYFAETVIGTASGMEENIGSMDAYDQAQHPATKIHFEKTSSLLRGFNVNIDKRLNQNDSLNHVSALEIPVAWTDYEADKNNGRYGMIEEPVRADRSSWQNRRFVEINFEGTKTIQNNAEGSKLVEVEITKDYIGFTILRQDKGVRVKYAFLRVTDRGYAAKVYKREDIKKIGFFTTQEEYIRDYSIDRKEDLEKRVYLNRFNPKAGKIVFHFTTSSPKSLREVGKRAVEEWSKTFQKAAGIKVELDDSFDAGLGDLRYNSINLIESVSEGGGLLGFGPSITDPHSGEIISATANIHVTPLKSGIVGNLRNFIRGGVGQLGPNELPELAPTSPIAKSTAASLEGHSFVQLEGDKFKVVKFETKTFKPGVRNSEDFSVSIRNFAEDLNRVCPSEVAQLKALYSAGTPDKDTPLLESCANKLLPEQVLPVLLHEMGHNFGLRHNFTSSNDVANFSPASETGGRQVHTASVMDYLSFNEDYMIKPGKYDDAAIKYGYGGADINSVGKFKYCTDEDVDYLPVDPMCARFDAGVTAKEIVENYIRDYKALYSTTNFRYDRYWSADQGRLAMVKYARYMRPMKRMYDQWRLELAQSRGLGSEYLETVSTPQQFEAEYAKVKTPRLEDLRAAAQLSFTFLRNIVFLPNRYCVVKTQAGSIDAIELERVRYEINTLTSNSVKSCSDKAAGDYLSQKGFTTVGEIGYSLNDIRYSLDPRDVDQPNDIVGTEIERIAAALTLTQREATSVLHVTRKTFPNYMDEPGYRQNFEMGLFQRVVGGLIIEGVTPPKTTLPRFLYEKRLLMTAYALFLQGLQVPDRPAVSAERLTPYRTFATRLEDNVAKAAASADLGGTFIAAMSPKNAAAKVMIDQLNQLSRLDVPAVSKEEFAPFVKFASELPSKEGLETVTVKDFMATVMKLIEILQKNQAIGGLPSFKAAVDVLGKSGILQSVQAQLKDASEEDTAKINASNVVEILKKGGFEYPLVKENFANLEKEIEEVVGESGAASAYYKANKLDIDAQIDIIIQVLMMNAQ